MAELWRLHLRPEGIEPKDVVCYCRKKRILGLGWDVPDDAKGLSGNEYLEYVGKCYDGKLPPAVRDFMKIKENDLIWARDAEGGYLLGRVESKPKPQWDSEAQNYGMFHVVSAHIIGGRSGSVAIRDTEVPGLVKARFSMFGPAFQRIWDQHARDYSHWLFAKKTCLQNAPPRPKGYFIELLDPYALEDLVILYLEEDGDWRVVLSSHAQNTPRYEVTLVNRKSQSAGVQVKHGDQSIAPSLYGKDVQVDQVFLFAASGKYGCNRPGNVTTICPNEIIEFARQNLSLIPETIKYWWDCSLEANS